MKKKKKLNKLINEANVYINTVKPNTEEENKDSKIFVQQKRKKAKSGHLKLMKAEISGEKNDIAISLELEDKKNLTVGSKTTLVKTSKMKNEKSDKLEKLTENIDNTKENEEGKKSNTKKKHIEDTKIMNEIKKEKAEKILNNSSNSKFKPPEKRNKNDTCEANQSYNQMNEEKTKAKSNLHSSSSVIKEKKNLVIKELSEKNLEENKQCNKAANTKYSTTEKMVPENVKNMESNKSIKKYTECENNLENDDIEMTEKNLKSTLKSKPIITQENKNYTSNDFNTAISGILNTRNNKGMKEKKKQTNKKNEEDLASAKVQAKIENGRTKKPKKYIKNFMKEGSTTKDLSALNTEKSEITDTFNLPIKQNMFQIGNKRKRGLKVDEIENETHEIKQIQDNETVDLFDDIRDEEIPCNKDSKNENFPISFEITGQQSEEEDSDPFEAE